MSVKIYDSAIGAFRDADTPLIWDEASGAYKDSTGLVWNESMQAWEERWGSVKLVPFSSATYEEIEAMANAYYNDRITLEQIKSVWSVGDMHSVNLSAMEATGVGESHRAQTVQHAILDFEHDELTTPINGHTKALISLGQKDCLMDATSESNPIAGYADTEIGYMNSTNTSSGGWKSCARRTWCNNVYFSALPTALQNMVKTVNKKSSIGGSSTSGTEVTADKIFLAAEIELFGYRNYSVADEGTQYQYYKNATANNYKMPKWSPSYVSHIYWERSTCRGNTNAFCIVDASSSATFFAASGTRGIAPCLCI